MAGARRLRQAIRRLIAGIMILAAGIAAVLLAALLLVQTSWGKDQLRDLIVRQANRALTAHLAIGRLEGSLFNGVTLRDVRLTRDGRTLVAIRDVSVLYSLREIWTHGIVIDRLRVVAPRIEAARESDGRWDLATLVRPPAQPRKPGQPARSVLVRTIEVDDGTIVLDSPVTFGAVHIPGRYDRLNARLGFETKDDRWRLRFDSMSWRGSAPDLAIDRLTGTLGNGPDGFSFDRLFVATPRTAFTITGTIHHERAPTTLALVVHADRFSFPEWGGILHGLANIAVDSRFDVTLNGPTTAMAAGLALQSTGGDIAGQLTLDASVPGWLGRGTVNVARLDLARWLNQPDRPSDITGRVTFDLALRLGHGFPRGRYAFEGPHAGFMQYAADDVRARGSIDAVGVLIESAAARAYGADVTTRGTIGIDAPFPYRFAGTARGLDLRRIPRSVPVPRVETTLAFEYDVHGRFRDAYVAGRARLARSIFLGATIADGTVGTIDSSARPLRYGGRGAIADVDLGRFGRDLDIATLREPRYQGRVSGRFTLDASGTSARQLELHASGHLARADVFSGTLHDDDVSLDISHGSLAATFDGPFERIDPAVPLLDPRFSATLSGSGRIAVDVRDFMRRSPEPGDYDVTWNLALGASRLRGFDLSSAHAVGMFRDSLITLTALDVVGPTLTFNGHGTLAPTDAGRSDFFYAVPRAELDRLGNLTGYHVGGLLATSGQLTGPRTRLHLAGHASATDLAVRGVDALSASGDYEFDVPSGDPFATIARLALSAQFVTAAGHQFQRVAATVTLHDYAVTLQAAGTQAAGRTGSIDGAVTLAADRRSLALDRLTVELGGRWQLAAMTPPPRLAWGDGGITITPLSFVGGPNGVERIDLGGSWRPAGGGELRLSAENVHLASFQSVERPPIYRGLLNADVRIAGTRAVPIVTGELTIVNGRIGKVAYDRLTGRVAYANRFFTVDFRLDQNPTTWATAKGRLPLALFDRQLPEQPIDLQVESSPIDLALLDGLTSVVTTASGTATIDVHAIGTSRDPHFQGRVEIANAAFVVAASGVAYNRVSGRLSLHRDRITVESLHIEDTDHHTLDLDGSLATHELKVGALRIEVRAHDFTVLRNEWGHVAADMNLTFTGRFESPVLQGAITITSGELNVDNILEQTLFQPYSTQAATVPGETDALVALNPWDRLRINLSLDVPNSLRLSGNNVQITPGTPIGMGDINLRVGGNLSLTKDPGQRLGVYGSFDNLAGSYSFQSRRFEVQSSSSINFRGTMSPELYVQVARDISGVDTRVTLNGPLDKLELHLSSSPPLDQSDILSLIVFNTSAINLTAVQQQQLAVRAGALAAGFISSPLVSALQSHIGLDVLELSPAGDFGLGPKLTVGEEIAPNLYARFSQQFGQYQYSQVEIRYYLTRILQLRATFSDATSLNLMAPFQLIERGGIDLLLFFSF